LSAAMAKVTARISKTIAAERIKRFIKIPLKAVFSRWAGQDLGMQL